MAIFFSVVLMDLGNLDADKKQEWKEGRKHLGFGKAIGWQSSSRRRRACELSSNLRCTVQKEPTENPAHAERK